MKKLHLFIAVLISIPSIVSAAYVDFNNSDDFLTNFSQRIGGRITSNPTGGAGNTGSVSTNSFDWATYNNESFDFSTTGSTITVSANFLLNNLNELTEGLGRTWGEIYLVPEANSFPYTDNSVFIDFKHTYPTGGNLQDEIFGGPLQIGGGSFQGFQDIFASNSYQEGHWYELLTTFENLNGQIGYQIQVNDFGLDGQTFMGTATEAYHITNDPYGFTSDTSVYAGFMLSSSNQAFDNFSATLTVIATPVPASLYLFGSGLIGLIGLMKRKKA